MNKRFKINNLRFWNAGIWRQYETKTNIFLNIHIDQLLITSDYDGKILESLNMNGKIKGIYKDDVLVLILSEDCQEVRKIKFQIIANAVNVLRQLGLHFSVTKYNSTRNNKNIKFRDINMHFQTALNKIEQGSFNFKLPVNYIDFVKICLMDPLFPQIITETEKILNNADIFENKMT